MGEPPTDSVFLITGDPDREPASFTRFALPFVWSLDERTKQPDPEAPVYRRDDVAPAVERRRYFTPETADALYNRALWLKLSSPATESVLHVGERPLRVKVFPPRIVLFEGTTPAPEPVLKTGFLLVDIALPKEEVTLDQFLVVNELFRYWREPWRGHEEAVRTLPGGRQVSYRTFLGDDVSYTKRWASLLRFPVELPNGEYRELIADAQVEKSDQWITTATGDAGWIAQTDERAFVWTCVLTEHGADGDVEATNWGRILNVDMPSTASPTPFETGWMQPRTYDRWRHVGTLYGFNVHSGAMLGRPCDEPPTWLHFRELYFDQVLMLLYLRVSTLRFSKELSEVSEHLEKNGDQKQGFKEFRRLRRSFAFLTNVYRFPLLSSQQQGIEMYACARRQLDVDELFDHVQKEIESTHEFFEVATAGRTADTTRDLTWIAAIAGVLAVTFTALAVDWNAVLAGLNSLPLFDPYAYLFAVIGLPVAVVIVFLLRRQRRNRY